MQTRTKILVAALMASAVGVTTALPSFAASPTDAATPVQLADSRDRDGEGYGRHDRGPRGGDEGQRGFRHGPRGDDDDLGPGGPGGHGGPRGFGGGPGGPGGMSVMVERFDVNDDGAISKDEIATVSAERLKAFDKNADGKLSLEEFTALWTDTMKLQIVRSFQERDPDGDAMVTIEEYSAPFDKMLARMDRNDDGQIDTTDMAGPRGPRGPGGPQDAPPAKAPAPGDAPANPN